MKRREHFVGVAGSGVGALAQFAAMSGREASGSDRFFDRGDAAELRRRLEAASVRIVPQDGSGVPGAACVVVSTAVEERVPDLARAKELGIPVIHRADRLAEEAARMRTVAVAGTSGKSTAAAMVYEVLAGTGRSPSVITGGELIGLRERGLVGNAFRGSSDLLVIEADESDGTVTRYKPWIGLLLNAGRDHKELSEVRGLFSEFLANSKTAVVNADAAGLSGLGRGAFTFGFSAGELRGEGLRLEPSGCSFTAGGASFRVPAPGRHNAENALAAAAACLKAGVPLSESARALAAYRGVSRRFQDLGSARGVSVIDDYAHNPDKVRAALAAARLRGRRILAVFQPHGYGPTRFLKDDFIAAFAESLGDEDRLWMPEIFYAGGTAVKDISSRHLAEGVAARGRKAAFVPKREDIVALVAAEAGRGDVVLVMGARDPGLGDFARSILERLTA